MGYQTVFRRYEKKYLVTQEQYDRLAAVFAPRMERDRFSESTISNIYYDTPDFRLIRRSLDRPAYKEKLRLRTYRTPHADTEAFVEIKKKYDHVVYKRRIGMNYQQAVDKMRQKTPRFCQVTKPGRKVHALVFRLCAAAAAMAGALHSAKTDCACILPRLRYQGGEKR